jgi:hypothetical protein
MYHYLNNIDDDEIDDREWIIEDDDEKINKRLIPYDYTFYKIYKDGCESYIGSTVNLYNRKIRHKSDCNNQKRRHYNYPLYKYIRENGGYNTFNYEILDKKFVCKKDAEIYEGELMKIHNSTLNKQRNFTDSDKKEHHKQNCRNFHKKNPEYNKEYREKNPEYHKEYHDKYHEKKKQYNKKYREKQKQQKQIIINLTINLPQD